MQADVPYGAFLSGGIDSSLIAALMQKQSSSKIKTFSIGFDHEQYNESVFAAKTASHLGTDHTQFKVNSQDALDLIPSLAELYDQPFADSSQLPTYLVSKMGVINSYDIVIRVFNDRTHFFIKTVTVSCGKYICQFMQFFSETRFAAWGQKKEQLSSFIPKFRRQALNRSSHKVTHLRRNEVPF